MSNLTMTVAQAETLTVLIDHGISPVSIDIHPYSGAATITDRRGHIMLSPEGRATYVAQDLRRNVPSDL